MRLRSPISRSARSRPTTSRCRRASGPRRRSIKSSRRGCASRCHRRRRMRRRGQAAVADEDRARPADDARQRCDEPRPHHHLVPGMPASGRARSRRDGGSAQHRDVGARLADNWYSESREMAIIEKSRTGTAFGVSTTEIPHQEQTICRIVFQLLSQRSPGEF